MQVVVKRWVHEWTAWSLAADGVLLDMWNVGRRARRTCLSAQVMCS